MLRNFRLRTLKGTPKGSSDFWVTSGSHVTTTTTKKKAREKAGHAQNLLPVRNTSAQRLFRSHDFVTSVQDPTRENIAQLPVAHAQNILPDMVISGHVTDVTSGHVTDFTSGSTTSQHHLKCDLSCTHILLLASVA